MKGNASVPEGDMKAECSALVDSLGLTPEIRRRYWDFFYTDLPGLKRRLLRDIEKQKTRSTV